MNTKWNDDKLQFARLIAELEMVGGISDYWNDLTASMDLENLQLSELVDRAQEYFDRQKQIVSMDDLFKASEPVAREFLIAHCERCIVPIDKWSNRDSHGAQEGVGRLWALLKSGCKFRILTKENSPEDSVCLTNDRTIWVEVTDIPGFSHMDCFPDGEKESGTFYIPTPARLEERFGMDWY